VKVFRDFAKISTDFKEFCPDIHQIKTLGVRLHPLHPRLLHQCLQLSSFTKVPTPTLPLQKNEVSFGIRFLISSTHMESTGMVGRTDGWGTP